MLGFIRFEKSPEWFGINVPAGSYEGPSRFLYYIYVWRGEKDPLSGVLRMLSLLADIVERVPCRQQGDRGEDAHEPSLAVRPQRRVHGWLR